jgi:hypothetical protein
LKTFGPKAEAFRNYLNKDCGEHEARAEGYKVFEKAFAKSVHARPDKHKSAEEIRARSEQTKQKQPYKSSVIRIHSIVSRQKKFS